MLESVTPFATLLVLNFKTVYNIIVFFKLNCLNGSVFDKFNIIYMLYCLRVLRPKFRLKKCPKCAKKSPESFLSEIYRPKIFVVKELECGDIKCPSHLFQKIQ